MTTIKVESLVQAQFAPKKMEESGTLSDQDQELKADFALLDAAIDFQLNGIYSEGLSKDQKRSVRRKAKTVVVENGDVYLVNNRKGKEERKVWLPLLRHHAH